MNWNWGAKIAIFYTIFAASMVSMVLWSTTFDVNLVTENYYAEELDHDARMQAVSNSKSLDTPLSIAYKPGLQSINLEFPAGISGIEGKAWLYCISDRKQDQKIDLNVRDGKQSINTTGLKAGRWRVKVDWSIGDKRFFDEKGIILLNQ